MGTYITADLFTQETITVPEEALRAMKAKIDAKKALLADLPRQIQEDEQRYKAALLFAPPGFNPDGPSAQEKPVRVPPAEIPQPATIPEKASWTMAIRTVLDASQRGMVHQEVFEACLLNFPDLSRSTGEKGFYNAIKRLSDRGDLVKHNGRLYSGRMVQDLRARGESLPNDPPPRTPSGGSGDLVVEALRNHPDGLSGPELKQAVAEMPNAPKSLREHGQYIYSILKTLQEKGHVLKDGALYRLATELLL